MNSYKREVFKIRSSIKPQLLGATLKRGSFFGAAGALLIIFGGTFLSVDQLKVWGIPIFFSGLLLIAFGLYPYRKLNRLETKPHEFHYDGETFFFLKQGKPLFKIAEKSIEKMDYVEKNELYGIAIWLRRPIEEKVLVLQAHFDFKAFASDSAKRFEGCDLFLPFFSKNTWLRLQGVINS